jgi:hypothetical protein
METKKNELGFKVVKDWSVQARQLKRKFPLLTDVDLKFEAGKEESLVERLVIKLHKKRPEVVDLLIKGQSDKA